MAREALESDRRDPLIKKIELDLGFYRRTYPHLEGLNLAELKRNYLEEGREKGYFPNKQELQKSVDQFQRQYPSIKSALFKFHSVLPKNIRTEDQAWAFLFANQNLLERSQKEKKRSVPVREPSSQRDPFSTVDRAGFTSEQAPRKFAEVMLGRAFNDAEAKMLAEYSKHNGDLELIKEIISGAEVSQLRDLNLELSNQDFILALKEALDDDTPNPGEFFSLYRELRFQKVARWRLALQYFREKLGRVTNKSKAPANKISGFTVVGGERFISSDEIATRIEKVLTKSDKKALVESGAPKLKAIGNKKAAGKPRITLIMSLYNGQSYIEPCLNNIVQQTIFDQVELIVIDACSTDNGVQVIKRYQEVYKNIKYVRCATRVGIYAAWNIGAREASADLLTNWNVDDVRRADCLEKQCNLLERFPNVSVAYQDVFYLPLYTNRWEYVEKIGYRTSLPTITKLNLLQFNSPHNAPVWRKSLHDEVGYFDESFLSAGDYEFWLRCADQGKLFMKLRDAPVGYFYNPEGISTSSETKGVTEARRIRKMYSHMLKFKDEFQGAAWGQDVYDYMDKHGLQLADMFAIAKIKQLQSMRKS